MTAEADSAHDIGRVPGGHFNADLRGRAPGRCWTGGTRRVRFASNQHLIKAQYVVRY